MTFKPIIFSHLDALYKNMEVQAGKIKAMTCGV